MAHLEITKSGKYDALGLASQSVATTTKTGTFWSMADAKSALFVMVVGAVTAAVTIQILQGTVAGTGGTTKAITGKTAAIGTANANSVMLIEVEDSELDVANGYMNIVARAIAAAAGGYIGAAVHRVPLRFEPASLIT